MIEDLYENIIEKLYLGPLKAPKHEKILELLKILWNEKEIKILSHFPKAGKLISLRELENRTKIPQEQLRIILKDIGKKGTTCKKGKKYGLLPLVPGIFEKYFIAQNDSETNLKRVGKIFRFIFDNINSFELFDRNFELFRPLLPIDSKNKFIEVDESINVETEVYTYELVEELINKNEIFATIPCACRLISEFKGTPCKKTTSLMGCFFSGPAAEGMIKAGVAKSLSKEEAIDYLRETEKAGLVHCASNDTSTNHVFICNCCDCCCAGLGSTKQFSFKTVRKSNFSPIINVENCMKCDSCIEKCPMDALSHSDINDKMIINKDICLGCGVCASNCPNEAIKLIKRYNYVPPEQNKIGNRTFLELLL
ncbi:MAG: hypothetical protein EAX96_20345 [Candidatus Lokiarchaeota archaeon]|nr:hypothetical protein [Candidatus Lokiarchaeota archaeon]